MANFILFGNSGPGKTTLAKIITDNLRGPSRRIHEVVLNRVFSRFLMKLKK